MNRRNFLSAAVAAPVLALPASAAPDTDTGTASIRVIGETADWSPERWREVIKRNGWKIVQ